MRTTTTVFSFRATVLLRRSSAAAAPLATRTCSPHPSSPIPCCSHGSTTLLLLLHLPNSSWRENDTDTQINYRIFRSISLLRNFRRETYTADARKGGALPSISRMHVLACSAFGSLGATGGSMATRRCSYMAAFKA